MSDGATLLFALLGFRVLDVTLAPDGGRNQTNDERRIMLHTATQRAA